MSNKKNLPNIPIYIGDWERDCNVLSLESEAAWMRIIFKMWTSGKQSTYKIPAKSLQNLWRCSPNQMREILDDFIYNEIADIVEGERFVEFTCRRFVKENNLSKVRSKAAKGIGKEESKITKPKQTSNKPYNKSEQNAEIDIDNDYVIEIKDENVNFGNSENFQKIQNLKEDFKTESTWKESVCRNVREIKKDFSLDDVDKQLETFFNLIISDGEDYKTISDTKKHFNRWLLLKIKKDKADSRYNQKTSLPAFTTNR